MRFFIAYLVFFVLFLLILVIGFKTYHFYKKEKYSFLKFFPSELEIEETFPYWRITLALFSCAGLFFHADFFLLEPYIHVPVTFSYILGILFMISDLLLFPLMILKPASSLKKHIVIASFFLAVQCLSNLSGVFYILRSDTSFVLGIVLFSFVFLAELISLFLKDLLSWSAMKKVETEDGKINYVRGKWNALALREWFFFFALFLTNFLFLLFRFVSEWSGN